MVDLFVSLPDEDEEEESTPEEPNRISSAVTIVVSGSHARRLLDLFSRCTRDKYDGAVEVIEEQIQLQLDDGDEDIQY